MMAQACAFNAVPICTLYATLTVDDVGQSLAESGAKAIFTNAELLVNVERIVDKTAISLIVYDGKPDEAVLRLFERYDNLELMSIEALRKLGRHHPHQGQRAKRDDVYCCMYTSGGGEHISEALADMQPEYRRVCC